MVLAWDGHRLVWERARLAMDALAMGWTPIGLAGHWVVWTYVGMAMLWAGHGLS
jgi:hypothetical protein